MFIQHLPLGIIRKYGAKRFMSFGAVVHKDKHDDHAGDHHVDHGDNHGDHGDHHHHEKPSRPKEEYNTVSKFLDHAHLETYFEVGPGYMKYPGVDYHAHHHAAYDWRTDPKFNKDIEKDVRDMGNPGVETYQFPFVGRDDWQKPYSTDTRHLYSNTLVYKPENMKAGPIFNLKRVGYWDQVGDINHEYDYESEDYDYQTDNFRTQHFRKTGPLYPWLVILFMPYIYFWAEFLFQHYPDDDHWRLQRTPPLNYPDTDDTDDTDTVENYKTKEGRYLQDIGIIGPKWFDIIDGKKVYNKWAGVNQPMEDI